MNPYIELVRGNPNYTKLWIAQAISILGDWFSTIALSTLVAVYSNGSGLAISLYLICRFVPPVVVGPWGGVLLDRTDRKRILIASDLARVGIVLGFLLTDSADRLWLIFVLTFVQFSVGAIFEPGRSALLPNVVDNAALVPANMLGSITWSVMAAVGGTIGGMVVGMFGLTTALVLDAITFAISALIISQVQVHTRERAVDQPAPGGFVDGLRYVRQRPAIGRMLMIKATSTIGSLDTLMIIYATTIFVLGDHGAITLGILWAAFGAGSVIGPAVFEHFNDGSLPRLRRLILAGYVGITAGWMIFASAPTLAFVVVGIAIKALGGTNWSYSSVILQRLTPDHYLGRIFSLDLILFQGSLVICILLTGIVVDLLGMDRVRVVVLGTALISLLPLLWWTRVVRRYDHHADAELDSPVFQIQ